jgi:hypothetical protein
MNALNGVTVSNNYNDYIEYAPTKRMAFITEEFTVIGELKITIPESEKESLETEFEEKSIVQSTIMELKSINHPRLELVVPITLLVEYIENEYIVSSPLLEVFTYGQNFDKAKEDFGILLGDYYESLQRSENSLAVNLHNELKLLGDILIAKS